ncbi:MAG: mechanosensitive ion channel, partial [Desulfovibrio sp.]|nr:mechanosensitive ion channel [Desulfovibrio sp.]
NIVPQLLIILSLLLLTSLATYSLAAPEQPGQSAEKASSKNATAAQKENTKASVPASQGKSEGEGRKAENDKAKEDEPDRSKLINDCYQILQSLFTELVDRHRLAEPWRQKWHEAQVRIKMIRQKGQELQKDFADKHGLLLYISQAERNLSQLMPSVNRFNKWASLMEAVRSRLFLIERDLMRELRPLYEIKRVTEKQLETIKSFSSSSVNLQGDDPELIAYQRDLKEAHIFLENLLRIQNNELAPADALKEEIKKIRDEITQNLPTLWKDYYLQKPLPWLDASTWIYLSKQFDVLANGLEMRRSLELPSDTNDWRKMGLRFLICAVLSFLAITVLHRQKWLPTDTNPVVNHVFKISLPTICLGVCFFVSSFSPQGENFGLFMAIGNLIIIFGQMLLAWDLRMLSAPDIPHQTAPLLRLFPLTCIAYTLLYLPLLRGVILILWLTSVIGVLIWRRFWPELNIGELRLESNIRSFDGFVLWLCLILTLCGLHLYSMIAYLFCVSLSLAFELCLGGISQFTYLNENQPQEGLRAILSNIAVALAVPIIMIITISSVLLWVATLPGGRVLMEQYLFKNFSIGSTEFNLLHILIIISAFFLTKAVVVTGSRYLSKIITNSKNNIDATLVTPAQTAYTYIVWIFFALFVMHILDIDLKNAAMVMTGLSVGIGMGLQSIVNNFFSGLLLIFGRMLQVGDVIEVAGITGRVARISVRDTLVQTYDNAFIYVPNSEFISGHLINWTHNDSSVRTSVSVGVAYGSDTDLVVHTMKNIVTKHAGILRYPEPSVLFQNFGDNTLDFTVYFWVNKFDDRLRICTEIRLAIDREFAKKHIEIAFPQLDVHLKPTNGKSLSIGSKRRERIRPLPYRGKRIKSS